MSRCVHPLQQSIHDLGDQTGTQDPQVGSLAVETICHMAGVRQEAEQVGTVGCRDVAPAWDLHMCTELKPVKACKASHDRCV